MAEKVPSFKSGGALWFVDLTTPDSLFILPVLTTLTSWITVDVGFYCAILTLNPWLSSVQYAGGAGREPVAGNMKKLLRIFVAVSIPVMVTFPRASFCCSFTSNLFSLAYGLVIRRPEVKKLLGLPDVPTSAETAPQPEFSLFSEPKRHTAVKTESSSPKTTKFTEISVPPSVVSQRRQRKGVRGRKKSKN
ncbi:mitochondrial inner membrane protein OXA1-like [Herrania umbratica]|uniref:Mitochondrial inner membrane protein OXA1-like n=1 Tax=Herrania umbratica TaxID=108875 RepID=A0A6J0ZYT7_9ROSI|nr:mitochondrial inner membrane protein OXA1-like [Herrania umbratica]